MTPKQAEILNYIIERQSNDGVSPSYREIARAVGVAGYGNIARHVQMLERDGWIAREPNHARSIRVLKHPTDDWIPAGELIHMVRTMVRGAVVFGEYDEVMDVRVDRALWETIIREVEDRCDAVK